MLESFSDLIDVSRVQQLTDVFYAATGIPTSVVDLRGNVLTRSGWQIVCQKFHRVHPETCRRCEESETQAAIIVAETEKYWLYRCPNGMMDAVTPVHVGGRHMANVIAGQFLFAPVDLEFFKNQARQLGFEEGAYLQAVAQAPVFDEGRLPAIMSFLAEFAAMLAELGLAHLKQLEIQQSLRESEQNYRLLAENVIDVIWRLDLNTQRFTYISPSIVQLRGFSVEEAMAQSVAESMDPEVAEEIARDLPLRIQKYYEGDFNQRIRTSILRQPCKDGTWVWVEIVTTLMTNAAGAVTEILGVSRDISARQRAEMESKLSQERLEMALRGSELGFFDANLVTGVTFFDTRYSEMLGYGPTLLNNGEIHWSSLLHPEDVERANAALQRCYRGEDAFYACEYRLRTKSGAWKWILARGKVLERAPDGRPLRFTGTHQDITERKRADQAVYRLAQRLENINAIDQAVLGAVPLDEICREVSIRLRDHLPCDLAGVMLNEPPGPPDPFQEGLQAVLQMLEESPEPAEIFRIDELDQFSLSFDQLQAAGLAGMHSLLGVPLVENGRRLGLVWTAAAAAGAFQGEQMEIVSEVVRELAVAVQHVRLRAEVARHAAVLEERVAARTSQLQIANNELETFAYSVSHDLKTPLRAIQGYSSMVVEDYSGKLDGQAQFYLERINDAALRMAQLIDDLLEYSRLERRARAFSPINLSALATHLLQEYAEEISRRQVLVQVELPSGTVIAEAAGLTLALRNLIDNALKFMAAVPQPRLEIGGRETENGFLLWVRDNGIGFEMIYHDRIFKVFQRLHRIQEYPGTGIGLAMVRKAMERMGGRAWAESAPGQGATFFLEIVRRDKPPSLPDPPFSPSAWVSPAGGG